MERRCYLCKIKFFQWTTQTKFIVHDCTDLTKTDLLCNTLSLPFVYTTLHWPSTSNRIVKVCIHIVGSTATIIVGIVVIGEHFTLPHSSRCTLMRFLRESREVPGKFLGLLSATEQNRHSTSHV